MPAIPMDVNRARITTVNCVANDRCTPYACAMNIAAAHSYSALPAWFIDAPSGITNPAMRSETFARRSRQSRDNGKVADEDAVENAVTSAGAIAGYSRQGFTRATVASRIGNATRPNTSKPASTHSANSNSDFHPTRPATAVTFAMSANTPMGASIITKPVMRIMIWNMPCQKPYTLSRNGWAMRARKNPNRMENSTRPIILRFNAASTMFAGTASLIDSRADLFAFSKTLAVTSAAFLVSASLAFTGPSPSTPGTTVLISTSAISTAVSVVTT